VCENFAGFLTLAETCLPYSPRLAQSGYCLRRTITVSGNLTLANEKPGDLHGVYKKSGKSTDKKVHMMTRAKLKPS